MLTPEQAAWVKDVLGVDVSALEGGDGPANSQATPAADGKGGVEAFSLPGIPSLPDVPDPSIKVHITIANQSSHALELVSGSAKLENPKGSEFETPPPQTIEAQKGSAAIVVSNNFPFLTGVGGSVAYKLADEATTVTMTWERGRVPKRKADMTISPDDPKRFEAEKGFDGDNFSFTLKSKDGPGPKPDGPSADAAASCLVTVTNNTAAVLTLSKQGHDRGDFMTFPAASVPPGGATSFASVKTPHDKDKQLGCKGFVLWEVGSPAASTWRCDWDNPEGAKNTATATLDPQGAGFKSLEQIGQGDDNVPVAFTLSGGRQGPQPTPTPSVPPTPPVPPGPDPEFDGGGKTQQPTLRKGDESADGWVEYAQELLDIPVNGKFDGAMLKAVTAFQRKNKCQADGVIGNETWSALRQGQREKVGTDGRQPHTFVEKGKQARWFAEDPHGIYIADTDTLDLLVESVGEDVQIENHQVQVTVTPPSTQPKVVKVRISETVKSPTGQGNTHMVEVTAFRKTFPSSDPNAKIEDYIVEAKLPNDLGGDIWKGSPRPV